MKSFTVVTLLHSPDDFRFAWYSYVGNVLSLLISALFSMHRQNITQNDAVFVILAVTSPSSIYLWFLTFLSFLRPNALPVSITQLRLFERHLLTSFSILLFWVLMVMAFLTLLPSSARLFSQPACNFKYSYEETSRFFWSAGLVAHFVSVVSTLLFLAWVIRNNQQQCVKFCTSPMPL